MGQLLTRLADELVEHASERPQREDIMDSVPRSLGIDLTEEFDYPTDDQLPTPRSSPLVEYRDPLTYSSLVWRPTGLVRQPLWPLLVYLHGAGEHEEAGWSASG